MEYYVMDSDRIMVLASDGVWEFISNKEVIEMNSHTPSLASTMIRSEFIT